MRPIEKLSITLPRDLAEKVREKVATGSTPPRARWPAPPWQKREDQHERKRAALRDKIGRSLDDSSSPLDEEAAFTYLEERFGKL
jgi:Arc/MetJ-type ribon-helix-helix transcriptional regulator